MKRILLICISAAAVLIYSCSDNSTSSSTTKDVFQVSTLNDTTTINFEISGLKISDVRNRTISNTALLFSTQLKVESVTSGSFVFNTYRDSTLCSTIQVSSAVDTTANYIGKINLLSFVPNNFSGKGTIVIRGHD